MSMGGLSPRDPFSCFGRDDDAPGKIDLFPKDVLNAARAKGASPARAPTARA